MSKMKWLTLAALLVIVTANFIIDFFLFSGEREQISMETLANNGQPSSRFIASFVERGSVLKFSLEKDAFEDLKKTNEKDLVAKGEKPGSMDRFIFENLGGQYQVRQENNKVVELQFASPYLRPKNLPDRKDFLEKNLSFFSDEVSGVRIISSEHDLKGGHDSSDKALREKFQMLSRSGRSLGEIQVFLDKDYNLIAMKVEKF